MTKRYVFDVTSNKTKDMQKRMERIRKHAHDMPYEGDNDEFLRVQKSNSVLNIAFIPTSWTQVIVLALVYAVLINVIKHSLYANYGTPEFHFSDPKLEAEFQYLDEKYGAKK